MIPQKGAPLAVVVVAVAVCMLLACGAPAGGLRLSTAGAYTVLTGADTTPAVSVPDTATLLPGRTLSSQRAIAIASALPTMRSLVRAHPGAFPVAYTKGARRWQVSFFARDGETELGQVLIDDSSGRVLEAWTGFQVAWAMARGYPGAFGEDVNAVWIWIPLSILFVVPFVDWRHPRRLLHLDLLALSSFSISLAFFNHADIYASTPLVYPPLVYLLVRALMVARPGRPRTGRGTHRGGGHPTAGHPSWRAPGRQAGGRTPKGTPDCGGQAGEAPACAPQSGTLPHLSVAPRWLAVGVIALCAFRFALNGIDGNVIDVGYAGVIGAQRIVDGQPLYGGWPGDNPHGDTYGPVNYEAYIPFLEVLGWSGHWDDLPAAHGAAIAFDLLTLVGLFLLGRRVRGPTLGITLAYAWAAYPFTFFTLDSDSNDALVAALVVFALLACTPGATGGTSSGAVRAATRGWRMVLRGVLSALAGLTKFAPLALAPLLATDGLHDQPRGVRARALAAFGVGFVVCAAVVGVPALTANSLHTLVHETLVYQADRVSPFSIWGLYGGLSGVQLAVQIGAVALALALAFVPRRRDAVGLAAAAAAILIAVQLGVNHWFYLYLPWFFGPLMLALLAGGEFRPIPAGASEPARSRQLAAA